ncbi:nicotinamide mononucleotide transporter PnuC [Tetragenococcus halophilus]|uniref:Nicotinamide mononucleotide transporter PnuC n=1 Tax=Tetragenococcus halophilus TaxID=51669 RepID=A0A3G5FHJ6_TETHA|nr:nicotinamide riboside transporter PnuC [Tetragenococcus halophilus]MDN6161773.1 nicotinamide riboside transporter PnuC [Atopostipes sp.]MDN6268028.1 nicotinamide riboside transporter PnuC [Tetragenococcus koreensis]MDN6731014.1 nicotinamide riboside transporter PnuC [Atopostipes suicloacalis]AYW49823.1 nicotinamide mononucleotide transporter PnuC [Tetragenococcus halophilus]GBD63043.1 putative nicotinamide mononucleotide transporter [Tetragenococcus halophilus subsp. flandriensis]
MEHGKLNALYLAENKLHQVNDDSKGLKLFNYFVTFAMVIVTIWGSFNNGWLNLANLMSWLGLIGVIGIAYRWKGNFLFNMSQNVVGFIVNTRAKLFGDAAMSLFFFGSQVWGIKDWFGHQDSEGKVTTHSQTNWKQVSIMILFLSIGIGIASYFLGGNYIILDAVTNATAIIAQTMHMNRNKNGWIIWTLTNIISIYMFTSLGVTQVAVMYTVFCFNNVRGWINWTVTGEHKTA